MEERRRDMQAIAQDVGDALRLTRAQLRRANRLGAGMAVLSWHGTFDDLRHGRSAFARELREEFRERLDDEDEEAEDDDEESIRAAARLAAKKDAPSRPMAGSEVDDFIDFLAEREGDWRGDAVPCQSAGWRRRCGGARVTEVVERAWPSEVSTRMERSDPT